MKFREAQVTIGGVVLNTAQSMTLRVAATAFLMELAEGDALGSDDAGKSLAAGYLKCLEEILLLMQVNR